MTPNPANPFTGLVYHWIGGLAAASFYIPYKAVKKWSWETYWLVGGFFSWIIAPLLFGLLLVPGLWGLLSHAPRNTVTATWFWGVMWGIGGLTFGLSMRYLGIALGYAIALGLCTAFGTLMPPIFAGEFAKIRTEGSGQVILLGIGICLAGIAVSGLAGVSKERELSGDEKKGTVQEFRFYKGLLVATFAGVMSASFAYGLAAGKPIAQITGDRLLMQEQVPLTDLPFKAKILKDFAAMRPSLATVGELATWRAAPSRDHGGTNELKDLPDVGAKEAEEAEEVLLAYRREHPPLWQNLPVLMVVTLGGFCTNFLWCVILNVKNRSAHQYVSFRTRDVAEIGATEAVATWDAEMLPDAEAAREEGPLVVATAQAVPRQAVPLPANYLYSAAAGVIWYLQFFFYSMGLTKMGRYEFSSWTLHMASIIIFSTLWGIALKEWKGTSRRTHTLIAIGLALLIGSTVVVGFGNYLKAAK